MPKLFADAIHPNLPEDTPLLLTHLEKKATSKALAEQWCGFGNNFEIELSDEDWEELSKGVWSRLPVLERFPRPEYGPRKFKQPLKKDQWAPYRVAFEECPPDGWQLIEVWRNRFVDQWVSNHEAEKEWAERIASDAMTGRILPRSDRTLIPLAGLTGRELSDSFLTVEELRAYAADFSLGTSALEQVKNEDVHAAQQRAAIGSAAATPTLRSETGPVLGTPRKVLVERYVNRWKTIDRDLKDAHKNGLDIAKAGKRDWHEATATAWAKANGKWDDGLDAAPDIGRAMHGLSGLPSQIHRMPR